MLSKTTDDVFKVALQKIKQESSQLFLVEILYGSKGGKVLHCYSVKAILK